ncbi:restriction endonuclease [Paraburkholderia hospita]|nr:restriction endonuclease [Paraburkholderia hospita]
MAGQLVALARTSPFAGQSGNGVLEDRRHALQARGVVGVLAAQDCTLEILPKIEVALGEVPERQNAAIRKRLVHMLSVALDLKVETGRITELDWQRETLLEILIRIFCEKLTEQLRRGIPRRYLGHDDDLPNLRGTLDVPRQFTRHAVNPGRLACRFDDLSEDIALNRIMKAAVSHLSKMSRSTTNQQRLRELTFLYADIEAVPAAALDWAEVVIDRTNRSWQDLFRMSQLFLRNQYQTTSGGKGQGTALLFEMSALFEEYVGRLVLRALARTEFHVTLQGGRLSCLTSVEDERAVFQTKPDILIRRAGEVTHVIDTKWKRISRRVDDPKQGVSQSDVYQMMAYAHLYKAPRLTLLYPHHEGLGGNDGIQAQFQITGQQTIIETASVDVANGKDLAARLRDALFFTTAE